MRVTQAGLWNLVRQNLATNSTRLREVEDQAVTGLLISKPSDAPELVGQIDRLQAGSLDQEVYGKNATQAIGSLDQLDSALGRVHDTLSRARELAVQTAGDLSNSDDRGYAALEVSALRDTLLDAANSNFGGRYIFAGTAYDTPPFADDGSYTGSTDVPTTKVGDSTWVDTGLDGSAVFDDSVDIFAAIDAFQTALEADDTTGIQSALDDIDAALDQVMSARANVGNQTNVATDASSLAESLGAQLDAGLSDIVSADPAETYMKLSELRTSYQTALQVAASARSVGLFDLM
ncbi:flagellar hook-associated protein 3 [Deltaproteobacteria bacterium]|nr:flagellar hook-associated protein 3 [Deltaproteobacteria bacterium]